MKVRKTVRLAVMFVAVLVAAIAGLASAGLPFRTVSADVRQLVGFRTDQFPEGMTVAPDGTIIVGILNTGDIYRITAGGTASKFANVPLTRNAFLTGLVAVDSTNVYALVQSQDDKNGLWLINQFGRNVTQVAKIAPPAFPNDLVRDAQGRLYVTDTVGGKVFRVTPGGQVETWASSPLLLGNVGSPGPFGFPLGANGISWSPARDALYVGVTEKQRLVRIPVRADGGAGQITVVAESPLLNGADGIDTAVDGTVLVAVNGQNQIVSVNPANGAVAVTASGPDFHFPSSVRLAPGARQFYVLNFDGGVLFNLAPGPPHTGVLRVDPTVPSPTVVLTSVAPVILPPATGSAGLADPAYTGMQ